MLTNLQALRFFAALAVVFYHGVAHFKRMGGGEEFDFFHWTGFAGVDIFFVISGFIMWYTARKLDVANFLYLRLTRIYVGYWPLVVLAALITLGTNPAPLAQINWPATLTLYPVVPLKQTILPVAWTLSFELYFYTLFALFLAIRLRYAIATAALIIGLSVMFAVLHPETVGPPFTWPSFLLSPFLLEFFCGVLIGVYAEVYRTDWPWLWIAGGTVGLVVSLALVHFALETLTDPLRVLMLGPCAGAIVYGVVCLEDTTRAPTQLVVLGGASYALYLCHGFLLWLLRWIIGPQTPVFAFFTFLVMVAIIVVYSVIHYRYIEQPLLRLSRIPLAKWTLRPISAQCLGKRVPSLKPDP